MFIWFVSRCAYIAAGVLGALAFAGRMEGWDVPYTPAGFCLIGGLAADLLRRLAK